MKTEDIQPNESLVKSKRIAAVPVIRSTHRPKWQARTKHHDGTLQHPRWRDQSSRPSDSTSVTNAAADTTYQPQTSLADANCRRRDSWPTSSRSNNRDFRSARPPPPTNSPSTSVSTSNLLTLVDHRVTRPIPPESDSGASHPGAVSQITKRRSREDMTVNRPFKKQKLNLKRRSKELRIDLPPECRKNAFQRSHFKSRFLDQIRDRMKAMGAYINQHQFTHTELIVTYVATVSLFPADLVMQTSATAGPPFSLGTSFNLPNAHCGTSASFGATVHVNENLHGHTLTSERLEVANAPSGSSVKLEDLPISVSSLLSIPSDSHTFSSSSSRAPLLGGKARRDFVTFELKGSSAPRQISGRPRPFRSGLITLSHGPPELLRPPSPMDTNTLADHETTDIRDTPSPRPQRETFSLRFVDRHWEDDDAPFRASLSTLVDEESEGTKDSEFVLGTGVFLEEGESTIVHLPRTSGDKARRILASHVQDRVYSATMYGYVYEAELGSKRYLRELRKPLDADKELVEDAYLFDPPFDNIGIVAQAQEDKALSLLHLGDFEEHRITPIVRASSDPDRSCRGVSAISTLPTSSSLSFVSAGYDHVIHLWSLDPASIYEQPPVAGVLDVGHTALVQTLLCVGDRLLSGASDNSIRTWDLQAAQMSTIRRTSNSVYQLHRTNNPSIVLAEVGHRDLQFELHDCRISAVCRPRLRFGYPSTQGLNGRYARGAVDPQDWNTFVSSGRDGSIRLWDLRNAKTCKQEIACFPGHRVVHTAFARDDIVAASDDNQLLYFGTKRI